MLVDTENPTESTSLLGASAPTESAGGTFRNTFKTATARLLDVRIQKWVIFSEAWNEIIEHFRDEDIISNREMSYLKFSRFGTFERFSHPIYLPVFQTAGVVDAAVSTVETALREGEASVFELNDDAIFHQIVNNVTMQNSVSEVWELGSYLISEVRGSARTKPKIGCSI